MADRVFISATQGVAAEREFYSVIATDDTDSLDHKITVAETEYANLHRDLIQASTLDPEKVARVLTHLIARGAHLRDSMAHLGHSSIAMIVSAFEDREVFRRAMGMNGPTPSGRFKEMLNEKYNELCRLSGRRFMSRYDFQMLAHRMAQARFDELFIATRETTALYSNMVLAELPSMAADGQRKALHNDIEPEARVRAYKELNWTFVDYDGPDLVLSDAIAVAVDSHDNYLPAMYVGVEEVSHVWFPVTSSRLLVGTARQREPIRLSDFNRLAAQVSWDLFISNPDTSAVAGLEGQIRSATIEFATRLLSEALADGLTNSG